MTRMISLEWIVLAALLTVLVAAPALGQSNGRVSSLGLPVRDGGLARPAAPEPAEERGDDDTALEEPDPGTRRTPGPKPRQSAPLRVSARSAAPPPLPPAARALVAASCKRWRVDERLVWAVMHQESGGHQRAVSPKGASGLMQLMPATARRFGVTDIFDPAQNIDAGVRYLRVLLDMFGGRVDLALAGYNAGEGRVISAGYRVPRIRETVHYVRAITARYGALVHP